MLVNMIKALLVFITFSNIAFKVYEIFKARATFSEEHKQFLVRKVARIIIDVIFVVLILLTT